MSLDERLSVAVVEFAKLEGFRGAKSCSDSQEKQNNSSLRLCMWTLRPNNKRTRFTTYVSKHPQFRNKCFWQFDPFLQVLRRRDFLWRTETERIGVLKEANVESIRRLGSNVDRPQVS